MIGLLLPTGLATCWAIASGGSILRLGRVRLEWGWLLVACFGVEFGLYNPPINAEAWAQTVGPWLWVATKIAMLAVAAANLRGGRSSRWSWRIMLAGLVLNTVAIVANGGHMPQSLSAGAAIWGPGYAGPDASHLQNIAPMDAATRFPWLCDILAEPAWLPRPNVLSVGDILLSFGMAAWVFSAIRDRAAPEPQTRRGSGAQPRRRFQRGIPSRVS